MNSPLTIIPNRLDLQNIDAQVIIAILDNNPKVLHRLVETGDNNITARINFWVRRIQSLSVNKRYTLKIALEEQVSLNNTVSVESFKLDGTLLLNGNTVYHNRSIVVRKGEATGVIHKRSELQCHHLRAKPFFRDNEGNIVCKECVRVCSVNEHYCSLLDSEIIDGKRVCVRHAEPKEISFWERLLSCL